VCCERAFIYSLSNLFIYSLSAVVFVVIVSSDDVCCAVCSRPPFTDLQSTDVLMTSLMHGLSFSIYGSILNSTNITSVHLTNGTNITSPYANITYGESIDSSYVVSRWINIGFLCLLWPLAISQVITTFSTAKWSDLYIKVFIVSIALVLIMNL
jgi:hypothetical protein